MAGPTPSAPPWGRHDRWLPWLAAAAFVVSALSSRDLWAPDEPRYGQVAREMLRTGDWLVPHVNGAPYAEKPPLFFWCVALLSLPFGEVTALTARLVGALFAAGAVLLTARLARRWFRDEGVGATAALLFATTVLVLWNGPRAGLDLPLAFFVLLAVERALVWGENGRLAPALAFGAAWAGAVLVKGPLGLLLPPLAVAGGLLASRRAPPRTNPGWWIAPLVTAGLCLAWAVPAVRAGGDAYADRLLGQIAGRVSGAEGSHVRGPLYYVLRLPVFGLPWVVPLGAGFAACFLARRAAPEDREGLGACAAAGPLALLLISLAATKREVYLVPVLPFLAAPGALVLHRGLFPRLRPLERWACVLAPLGLAAALLAVPFLRGLLLWGDVAADPEPVDWVSYVALVPAAAFLVLGAVAAWRSRASSAFALRAAAVPVLVATAVLHVVVLPGADRTKSFAAVATVAESEAEPGRVRFAGFDQGPVLLWNLRQDRVEKVEDAEGLARTFAGGAPRSSVVAEASWWDATRARVERERPDLAVALGRLREAWRGRVDHRTIVVLAGP
jgi:4-amino-4-deoxy-L-arabinose transferase-like glycosyltransferase